MTLELVCNFRKCRRALTSQAWVTTCSHVFCIEHGKREFKRNAENSMTCPACGSELRDKFDVIQADLKPGETFKSIVLAGMKPDTIMDIAMRAMSFWSYQVEQEALYQESLAKHAREKLQCSEEINTLNLQKLKADIETWKRKVSTLQADCNKKRKQNEELAARLEEKTRKLQKLTFQLDTHKRKDIRIGNHDMPGHNKNDNQEHCMDISDLVGQRAKSDAFVFRPTKDMSIMEDDHHQICSPKTPMFDFRKRTVAHQNQPHFHFRPVKS